MYSLEITIKIGNRVMIVTGLEYAFNLASTCNLAFQDDGYFNLTGF